MRPVAVEVPATSANIGPGFDAFGLALEIRNTFAAELADEWLVDVSGEGAESLARDESNSVARAMNAVFAETGASDRAAHVRCENRIPLGIGLGSSAAAVVGGVALASALLGDALAPERLFELAVEMEGHPDNVAAAVHGGFAIGWRDSAGTVRAAAIETAGGLAAILVEAGRELSTMESRSLLPDVVPHDDAAFNAGHAGLLAAGIATGDESLIAAGLQDRLHEPYRRSAIPDLDAVRRVLSDAGALGAVLSGAGPTVLGLVAASTDELAFRAAQDVAARAGEAMRRCAECDGREAPRAVPIARGGLRILPRG